MALQGMAFFQSTQVGGQIVYEKTVRGKIIFYAVLANDTTKFWRNILQYMNFKWKISSQAFQKICCAIRLSVHVPKDVRSLSLDQPSDCLKKRRVRSNSVIWPHNHLYSFQAIVFHFYLIKTFLSRKLLVFINSQKLSVHDEAIFNIEDETLNLMAI